ncbi:YihY/virulence factor BrkB family protein (plasmid) [Skermanella sp. TT6]|uniref:YihY/virulence factor BrkB family protein n=1 Tax=Skermanella cutis TaxID=2775420 RepID=A0ABX7BHC9_9PROT|nr:YihY/virulence factor BrkB family protein [Skermanella sp. TT6]QQP93000.1 YihY/virulence factor BrkB family protein [Skermanella sp. TT6]
MPDLYEHLLNVQSEKIFCRKDFITERNSWKTSGLLRNADIGSVLLTSGCSLIWCRPTPSFTESVPAAVPADRRTPPAALDESVMIYGVSAKRFVRDLYQSISDDNVFNGAAALGFYLTLTIFPALLVIMSVIPYLPIDQVDQAIMDLLGQALPDEASGLVSQVVQQVTGERRGGLLSISLLAALWAVSTGMYAVMQQLNITYDVKEARSFVRARATAIGLSLLFGVLVIGAFSLIVLGGIIQDWIGNRFGFSHTLLTFFAAFRWVIIVLALLLGFAMIYSYAPNVQQRFMFITPGSLIGVSLLIVASLAFSLYTRNFANYDATYGSIGAVVILMLWLYAAGFVILFGSEINVLLKRYSMEGSVSFRAK